MLAKLIKLTILSQFIKSTVFIDLINANSFAGIECQNILQKVNVILSNFLNLLNFTSVFILFSRV